MNDAIKHGVVLAAVLAVAVAVGWLAVENDRQTKQAAETAERLVEVARAVEVQAEVIELPNDGKSYYATLLLHDDWRSRTAERTIAASFAADPLLSSLRAQTHWNTYLESNPLYKERFAKSCPILPALLIQDSDGKVLLKLSGDALTGDIERVRGPIRRLWQARPIYVLPWRRPAPCPDPTPSPPQPAPDDEPVPDVTPLPDVTPQEAFPWWLLILAVVVGLAVPLVGYVKEVLYGSTE